MPIISILIGLFLSGVISVLGAPVFGYIWGPINPASTVFSLMAIVIILSKERVNEFATLLAIIAGIFLFDFIMGKYYGNTSGGNSGLILLLGSLLILAITVSFVPIIGLLEKNDTKSIFFFFCSAMALVIYLYGIIYGSITPGVSDGPKLAAVVSVILLKLKKEKELSALWIALFFMGILGNFIIPAIHFTGGLISETL